ncbi:serine--tRNA ligase [Nanchangia anserum]|uniref:Serine--tRNA ligase n=1 Tax=Nanchangia anserum TaxID=2692125 RepID=A0A8I0KRC2_9ACTO|nr:serine--tRNA ligase [Nanchangia anserum]MBD3689287.1 serine--tRNA ligase [Nanchangia anserum]QOX81505.1 serine--tRNA ligase [Nanchangia anserum]
MIDLRSLRDNPEPARASQRARGADPADVDRALEADRAWREALGKFESRRADQKALSKQIGAASKEERPAILAQAKAMAGEVKELEAAASAAEVAAREAAYAIPNIVNPGVPAGGEDDYVVLAEHGRRRDFGAEGIDVRDHVEIGEGLDAIDTKRGAKVSGSRFYFLKGIGARLELALLTCGLDLVMEAGFTPMITPTMVSPRTMGGTGFLGAHADEIYHLPADDLYLTGTSEVALAGYHTDEIVDLSNGPIRYAGWSSCYRREAGSHGKDVRGIIRVHQFNKVEMFAYTLPEDAADEHQRLLALEEQMLAKLELPYRVIHTAAGDLGSSAAEKFDCEAWLPSQERYLELTSTSNCTTFQARRLGIRYRGEGGTQPVATLNGTVVNTRWIVAFLENHQQADGSVYVPEALRPYLGGREVLTRD